MNREELQKKLDEENIDPRVYSLYGRKDDDQFVLDHKWCRWMCYYLERGHRFDIRHFRNEAEACRYMLKWILDTPYTIGENHRVTALNREQLKNIFDQLDIKPAEYSLYGPPEHVKGNMLVLDEQDGRWVVYSIQNSKKTKPQYFDAEWEAVLHIIESIDDSSVDRYTFRWQNVSISDKGDDV